MKAYFVLKDCVDEGETLIADADSDPVRKIASMEASEARSSLMRWDAALRRQGIRLFTLEDYIFGQDHLAVINPGLQNEINEVVGRKMDRSLTLRRIGAALFFRDMSPAAHTNDEKARYVLIMAGAEDSTLDMVNVKAEIGRLREGLDQYRLLVERLVSDEEILRLSHRARQETSLGPHINTVSIRFKPSSGDAT